MLQIIKTKAFNDQNPGTSGLRKKLVHFQTPHYVENFIQSIFDCAIDLAGQLLIVGGDGRLFNVEVCQKIIKMAAANGIGRIIIGQGGILSTPALSHLIRKYQAHSGIILTASHNPSGSQGDFGIKYDLGHGGPAPQTMTEAIFTRSKNLEYYKIMDVPDLDLNQTGRQMVANMVVDIINPVADYADLMATLFDFDLIRSHVKMGLDLRFDAMHAVTGPYAREIFVHRLGFAEHSIVNAVPMPDFAGLHPDPNPVTAHALYKLMMSDKAPDLGAASDGDGDRNLIIGRGCFVNPSDSLAILAANAHHVPAYRKGIIGVARSLPTSTAIDRVAQARKFDLYETPTGWKFFVNLLQAGKITLCGEESFGTGSTHLYEKDGIWAVLFWLNIMAATGSSVKDIVTRHWREFGRTYYSRHDYENLTTEQAQAMIQALTNRLDTLPGTIFNGLAIDHADQFTYTDPIDQSVSSNQGLRILFNNNSRLVFRLSGTGTQGATLRLYLEHYEREVARHQLDTQTALTPLIEAAKQVSNLRNYLKRDAPSLIT